MITRSIVSGRSFEQGMCFPVTFPLSLPYRLTGARIALSVMLSGVTFHDCPISCAPLSVQA